MSRTFHALVAVMLAAPFAAQSQAVPPGTSEVATSGRGEVGVAPDHAILVVGIEGRAPSAAAAASDVAAKVASTIAALRAAGVSPEQITTVGYSVSQDYDFTPGAPRRPSGFIALNSVRVDVRRVADIGKLIDAALTGGATLVSPIQYLPQNPTDARDRALALAVAAARHDAETIARAAGGSLGKLVYLSSSFSEQTYSGAQITQDARVLGGPAAVAAPTSLTPGVLTVSAVASTRWEFIPSAGR